MACVNRLTDACAAMKLRSHRRGNVGEAAMVASYVQGSLTQSRTVSAEGMLPRGIDANYVYILLVSAGVNK